MGDPQLQIGMKFRDFDQFKAAVRNYGIKNRYVMNFRPNDSTRCKAICTRGCPFYLWASLMTRGVSTVQIKSGHLKHECAKEHKNRHVNAMWIARKYMEQLRADPSWKLSGIMQAVKLNQNVEISRLTAYRAKSIALREIDGDEATQMASLYDYRLELLKTHPGSTVKFRCDDGIFEAMYVCLAPLRAGFLSGCRRVICVDGCFLKGVYGGQLLSAVGVDANNCSYPMAWAVVNKENKYNWSWFLQLLGEDLNIENSHGWAFVSDRQKV
ncbi:uncharacterized protein LOC120267169 [Dioscorea cayenensis subsp. rotundata]|uniref:Uncharacterized protein LOC120267169 n=1 Tax=Dioscorea cayennensis subsp. rotundata TaxID=55577 RepID=A0AB40BX40_DIOCR|nr:uncharacterized protein LOC120267169 [Dioscorea cayenensis subsp. rotundata]